MLCDFAITYKNDQNSKILKVLWSMLLDIIVSQTGPFSCSFHDCGDFISQEGLQAILWLVLCHIIEKLKLFIKLILRPHPSPTHS